MIDLVEAFGAARSFQRGGKTVAALAPTTCRVRAGDRIALLGPSGSGKSTLLHLMAGLDIPSAGEMRWPLLGRRDGLLPGKVAMVFQSPSLMAPLSVIENVELPLILKDGRDDARATAMEALKRVGLADLANKLPEELSGGQGQRVAMARAIAARPQLLLADEPTGQLDQATGLALIDGLLNWLAGSPTALVIATHDLAIAERMERIWHMDHGQMCSAAGDER
ncbi:MULTISPECIES: ATP-binding cassette domain-containing protein [Nitrobacteraceae]|jgi:putative ABC transport system ATP-binding protein/lipoprotein-releasing system ATP-binding protein|uniref:ABC transporter ATP-binding protein n=1 Tax=Nitrobacteraceae TaxID=41294 RepID=UPI0006F41B99|nr:MULTISPECIES: ATP-binding cassette domain-containing protein [Nitrobacteraceae]KQW18183.1 ABC transporter ATP-binding protein [Afipia sp. Root123D2]MBN9149686.1 ATP-binding cassette domain-containing protein [Nitrobacter sp.]OJV00347.1 MAG: ABC transporter ATP-binding protein [Nitrobacter sp. 62-23]